MSNGDYVLGTRSDEVRRLGIQHGVWRDRVIDALRRGGLGVGQAVVDVGAGPGFVCSDLAELVGPTGRVAALERAPRFIAELEARGLPNLDIHEHDVTEPFPIAMADSCWCRWLLCFTAKPELVIRNVAAALRPGGTAIFHEYAAYSTWRMMPPDPRQDRFRSLVEQSWKDSGGDPDIALRMPPWLEAAGLQIISTRTYADVVRPENPEWQWPRSFMGTNAARLHELGYLGPDEVEEMARLLNNVEPGIAMLTPLVAEIIVRRR